MLVLSNIPGKRRLIFCMLMLGLAFGKTSLLAQQNKYWILFERSVEQAQSSMPALSEAALARRAAQGIPLDIHDYLPAQDQLEQLQKLGVQPLVVSRWLNGVSAFLEAKQLQQLLRQHFIREIRPVARAVPNSALSHYPEADRNTHRFQLSQIGIDDLHAHGFRGQGVTIAVLDNGFLNANQLRGLQPLFAREGVPDSDNYVEPGLSVYDPCQGSCRHGTGVLSILASYWPDTLMGAAPEATYLLFRTEDDRSETRQEEDNWLRAAEKADSLGAHILVSSLTYRDFDLGEGDYVFSELDGQTALVTLAAEMAAAKGMLVVNAVGNRGLQGLEPPADGPSVLAVGSVNEEGERSRFSGVGPTFDGRIKPDLVALGENTFLLRSGGEVQRSSGTSYATPLIGGLAACLWQAVGLDKPAAEIKEALLMTASQAQMPDNLLGYGLPQATRSYAWLTGDSLPQRPGSQYFVSEVGKIFPNPSQSTFWLGLSNLSEGTYQLQLLDLLGRKLWSQSILFQAEHQMVPIAAPAQPGVYLLRLQAPSGALLFSEKLRAY
jgi:serine protease AprX